MSWQSDIYREARKSSDKRGHYFELTREEFDDLVRRADGCCMLTGIPFDFRRYRGCSRRPFAASLDRIDSNKGYTADNVRLVCVLVNFALNQWGLEPLLHVARNLLAREQEAREQERAKEDALGAVYIGVSEYLDEHDIEVLPRERSHVSMLVRKYCRANGLEHITLYDPAYPSRTWNGYPRSALDAVILPLVVQGEE